MHVEQAVAGNAVELKTDFRQTPAPSLQPYLQIAALAGIAVANHN